MERQSHKALNGTQCAAMVNMSRFVKASVLSWLEAQPVVYVRVTFHIGGASDWKDGTDWRSWDVD